MRDFKQTIMDVCRQALLAQKTTGIAEQGGHKYIAEKIVREGRDCILVISVADYIDPEIAPEDCQHCLIVFY